MIKCKYNTGRRHLFTGYYQVFVKTHVFSLFTVYCQVFIKTQIFERFDGAVKIVKSNQL